MWLPEWVLVQARGASSLRIELIGFDAQGHAIVASRAGRHPLRRRPCVAV